MTISLTVETATRFLLVVTLVAIAVGFRPEPAHACTCSAISSEDKFAASDMAFIGYAESRRPDLEPYTDPNPEVVKPSIRRAIYTFVVEIPVKGIETDHIELYSMGLSDSCLGGHSSNNSDRIGVVVHRDEGGTYIASMCSAMSPHEMLRVSGMDSDEFTEVLSIPPPFIEIAELPAIPRQSKVFRFGIKTRVAAAAGLILLFFVVYRSWNRKTKNGQI